ncbi:unnamed protein product [Caenorhabditis nigoni]
MDDTVIKEEVIEEEFNFTLKNDGFVEVKQEEKEIKMKPSETDEADDEFFEAVKLKKVSITGTTKLECGICQKMMPKNLLKLFKSEENKTVLAEIFKIERLIDPKRIFVCYSHVQTIIDDYDGKLKFAITPFEQLLRSFIKNSKKSMKDRTLRRPDCEIGLLLKQKLRTEPIDFFGNNNAVEFLDDIERKPGESASEMEKEMNEAVIKEEVIEEEHEFTFKNGEYVKVKQEEIEEKPEFLLEQEIKMEPIDFSEWNEPDEFLDDFELEAEKDGSKIETVSTEVTKFKCEICQKAMSGHLLKLIKSEDHKTVLAEMFKIERSQETKIFYVCVSHIQTIIDENDGKLKSPSTRYEQLLRTFISKHRKQIKQRKDRKVWRRKCKICHMSRDRSELRRTSSKYTRIVIIIGCILRGTHSVEQAKTCIANSEGVTCYSHRQESIDKIFEYLGIKNILEFSKCSTHAMDNLMNVVKKIDLNFTEYQFIGACRELFLEIQNFPTSL